MKQLIFSLIVLGTVVTGAGAQTSCSQKLKKAQSLYDEGKIHQISEMLDSCLEEGFSKTEKIAAYKLLTLTYLYFNERKKAETTMLNFLRLNPEYEINEDIDPAEFINLYNSFRTIPAFLIGVKGGGNGTDIDVKRNFNLDNSNVPRGQYYNRPGFQFGIIWQKIISRKFLLSTELNYVRTAYLYEDNDLFEYSSVSFRENLNWIQLPVLLNYNFGKSKTLIPYIYAGGSADYLLNSLAIVSREDETIDGNNKDVPENRISMQSQRNRFNFTACAGGGMKIKDVIGRGYLFIDIRYSRGIRNIVDPEQRYSNPDLIYDYLFIDNDFKQNTLQFSAGYILPVYIPKLKKVKPDNEI